MGTPTKPGSVPGAEIAVFPAVFALGSFYTAGARGCGCGGPPPPLMPPPHMSCLLCLLELGALRVLPLPCVRRCRRSCLLWCVWRRVAVA
eukprot:scaffold1844_cov133-Isochrysis_galbana.AAC.2